MIQSEYLKKKTMSLELKDQSKLEPILGSQFYTQCKKYAIENKSVNTSIIYGTVTPNIVNYCPTFVLCTDTNKRPNRIQKTRATTTILPLYVKHPRPLQNYCSSTKIRTYSVVP